MSEFEPGTLVRSTTTKFEEQTQAPQKGDLLWVKPPDLCFGEEILAGPNADDGEGWYFLPGELELVNDAEPDLVNHPPHYTSHPSGVECITITEHMGFNLGNALKYIWRADLKGNAIEDLHKARFYVDREIQRREAAG